MSANRRNGPGLHDRVFFLGLDAVLVAGSGLIIHLRKDIVGSNPTRTTKVSREGFRISEPFFCFGAQLEGFRRVVNPAVGGPAHRRGVNGPVPSFQVWTESSCDS